MSHTHEDRVAARDPSMCAVYGCPLMGTMTRSTSGANDWSCAFHMNKPSSQAHAITFAINRYRWLANAITDIRTFVPGRIGKGDLLDRIRRDFAGAGRDDLFWNGQETVRQWVNRLDDAFEKLVLPELLAQPQHEHKPRNGDTWQQAAFRLPQWA